MRDISLFDKCREWLNRKKATNTFLSTITHIDVSLQSDTRMEISIWHERERKEANICGLEMEIKSLLLVFYFGAPVPLPPPCLLLALNVLLPHFRMGVHGWVNGWISCKATELKITSFLPGLAYPSLFFPNGCLCLHLGKWLHTCKPGFPSSAEFSGGTIKKI